jgi:hypothetical protein
MLTIDTFLFTDEADIHFTDMISELLLCLRPLDFKIMDASHVSLSRTISGSNPQSISLEASMLPRFKPTIYLTGGVHANHYTTNVM